MALTPEQIRAWVERSCEQQQIPVAIADPTTLARIVVLLGGGKADAPEGAAGRLPSTAATPD